MNCSICLSSVSNPVTLICNHSFCYKCIDRWIRQTCSTCDVNHVHNQCPICRALIVTLDESNTRKTRSMTRCQRQHTFSKDLISKVHQWKRLKDMKYPPANRDTQLLIYLDEIMNIIYQNTWFFDGNTDGWDDFASVMKLKLDSFEKDGYKEAAIWKYKLRSILH